MGGKGHVVKTGIVARTYTMLVNMWVHWQTKCVL